ncbi:LamB/YcsF family protein [Alkaliphilus peptidifermentans]|uniref:5-oxoprolinase subunit A n=1 Tax=Alkaliphilus peptidifermentans DSM 18978 TaxID=1120976 RepID=A0A1G5JZW8_9FIRM|nr:5-oxoprolinase subunit PxpA [Alkaliphilus peptidifermentans]SCY93471.1 UPF0271 protein [Alkaliphilus peptidifermentans DSM 18978]
MLSIDLNCDLGESFGNYTIGNDEEVLGFVTSVNIACGYHAGDPVVMDKTVKLALDNRVAIGAHPSLPDLMGFGRRNMSISDKEARSYVIYQVGALDGFVKAHGGELKHVKPHGALYNMAATDYKLARAIAEAVYMVNPQLILIGLANSELIKAAKDVGLKSGNEVFADRAYNNDGTLVNRGNNGAVIHDVNECISRVIKMIKEGKVNSIEGKEILINADTVCIHGDNKIALDFAEKISCTLKAEEINIKALSNKL